MLRLPQHSLNTNSHNNQKDFEQASHRSLTPSTALYNPLILGPTFPFLSHLVLPFRGKTGGMVKFRQAIPPIQPIKTRRLKIGPSRQKEGRDVVKTTINYHQLPPTTTGGAHKQKQIPVNALILSKNIGFGIIHKEEPLSSIARLRLKPYAEGCSASKVTPSSLGSTESYVHLKSQ